jgi:hypothetical protein
MCARHHERAASACGIGVIRRGRASGGAGVPRTGGRRPATGHTKSAQLKAPSTNSSVTNREVTISGNTFAGSRLYTLTTHTHTHTHNRVCHVDHDVYSPATPPPPCARNQHSPAGSVILVHREPRRALPPHGAEILPDRVVAPDHVLSERHLRRDLRRLLEDLHTPAGTRPAPLTPYCR